MIIKRPWILKILCLRHKEVSLAVTKTWIWQHFCALAWRGGAWASQLESVGVKLCQERRLGAAVR